MKLARTCPRHASAAELANAPKVVVESMKPMLTVSYALHHHMREMAHKGWGLLSHTGSDTVLKKPVRILAGRMRLHLTKINASPWCRIYTLDVGFTVIIAGERSVAAGAII
jgi:hypothetical protein